MKKKSRSIQVFQLKTQHDRPVVEAAGETWRLPGRPIARIERATKSPIEASLAGLPKTHGDKKPKPRWRRCGRASALVLFHERCRENRLRTRKKKTYGVSVGG